MTTSCRTIAIALAALAIMYTPALGQTDLLNGQDQRMYVGLGMYTHDGSGNQDTVREFDGRRFDLWGLESLESYGYGGELQYWLDARSVIGGDADVTLDVAVRNELSLTVKTNALLHRLARIPGIDPYLSPLGLTGGKFIDQTPGNTLGINRRVNEIGVRLTPGTRRVAYRANWWQESEQGSTQFNYRRSSPSRLESVDFGVDRTTDQGTLGADVRLGSDTALNYSLESNQFSDSGQPAISGDRPSLVKIPSIKTTSNVIKARSRLSDRLYFSGVHINRNRVNETESLSKGRGIGVNSTNAALTFLASKTITLSGRYRDYKLDNSISPVLNTSGEDTNVALQRRERSLELESDFTGIRKALVRVGYERKRTERGLTSDFLDDPDLDEAMESATTSNIWRTSFNYHPSLKLSFAGRLEDWNIDKAAFKGSPGSRKKTNLNATYLFNDRLVAYADYNRLHDGKRDPTGLDNRFTDTMVGAWYGINGKLTMDALYSTSKIDATTLWEIAPNALDPPNEEVPYNARNRQFSVGLNYAMATKSSVYWRYLNSNSDGRSNVGALVPGNPALPDGWMPVNVRENRWTIGFTRDLTEKERVLVEYSLADWKDKIDSGNDGTFNLWRLAWSTGF